jgi:hypothetical protein
MATLEVPPRLNRARHKRPEEAVAGATFLIRHVCDTLGLADLSNHDVLDVGCGTRFTQAFLEQGLPIKSYVGVDVYREMIEFLRRAHAFELIEGTGWRPVELLPHNEHAQHHFVCVPEQARVGET